MKRIGFKKNVSRPMVVFGGGIILATVLAVIGFSHASASGETMVDQGKPGMYGPWPVLPEVSNVTCGTKWTAGADAGVQVCDAGVPAPITPANPVSVTGSVTLTVRDAGPQSTTETSLVLGPPLGWTPMCHTAGDGGLITISPNTKYIVCSSDINGSGVTFAVGSAAVYGSNGVTFPPNTCFAWLSPPSPDGGPYVTCAAQAESTSAPIGPSFVMYLDMR
jgi:hypothetical protein